MKFRGIKTTPEKVNEEEPVTIINRFGQKSISLPRIDDEKRWAGYPGLTGVSRKLARMIPECKYYVEPLAGTAKVWQEYRKLDSYKPKRVILNDKSLFIAQWLTREFGNNSEVVITTDDFIKCIELYDSENTFFLIDVPWYKTYYDQDFSYFDRKSVKQYSLEALEVCKKIKGKFMCTTRMENKVMKNSCFNKFTLTSEYTVCGRLPKVLVVTNIDWINLI